MIVQLFPETVQALLDGKKVFSKKEYSRRVVIELKAWDEIHGGKVAFSPVELSLS